MISVKVKGTYTKTEKWLKNLVDKKYLTILDKYGKMGVEALREYTPKDTGVTADAWRYVIETDGGISSIYWINDNVTKWNQPVVILLQYGHATGTGGYVEGIDFINPALQKVFDSIVVDISKEIESI